MWLMKDSEGHTYLCRTSRDAIELMEKYMTVVWTSEFVKIFEPHRPAENPEIIVNSNTGRVEKRRAEPLAVPLGRSGDKE